jgi:hypothetical protein
MHDYNTKSVNLKLSVGQEQTVVLASLKKHCSNLERELMQHALGNDTLSQVDISDNIKFIDSAMYVMRHYGD